MMGWITSFLVLILSLSINAQTFDTVGEDLPTGEDTLTGGFVGDYDDHFIDTVAGFDPGDCSGGTAEAPWLTMAKANSCITTAGADVYVKVNSLTFTVPDLDWGGTATNPAEFTSYCIRQGIPTRWAEDIVCDP